MKLIKILKNSLRKNPNAENTITPVFCNKTATFKSTSKLPKSLLKMVVITSETTMGEYEVTGYIINPNKYEKFLEVKGMSIEVNNNVQIINHLPEAKYFYKYSNPKLECGNCKIKTKLSEIEDDYDDDANHYTTCPKCKSVNSFEDIEYEKIENVVLEL